MTPLWHWIDTHAAIVLLATFLAALLFAAKAGEWLGWWDTVRDRGRVGDDLDVAEYEELAARHG